MYAAIFQAIGKGAAGIAQAASRGKERDEAIEMAEITRGDELRRDREAQELYRGGQALTERKVNQQALMGQAQTGFERDEMKSETDKFTRSALNQASTKSITDLFGGEAAQASKLGRF
jgi:hypothetical protein